MSQAGSLVVPAVPLPVPSGGTGTTSFNPNGVVISGSTPTSPLSAVTLNDGQLAIGATGSAPAARNLTPGAGISITNAANNITISTSGTLIYNYTTVNNGASPYTVLSTDQFLGVNTSGGPVTLNFPSVTSMGRLFIIKDSSGTSATNNIIVTSTAGVVTFDGSNIYTIKTNYEAINVLFNGTNYEVF